MSAESDPRLAKQLRDDGFYDSINRRESLYDVLAAAEEPQAEAYRAGFGVLTNSAEIDVAAGLNNDNPSPDVVSVEISVPDGLWNDFSDAARMCGHEPDALLRAMLDHEVLQTFGKMPEVKDGKVVWEPPPDLVG
jgi:hypothetical protein